MKSNKGVTLYDVIIAITVLSLFVGLIGTLFYQIVYNNNLIKYNAIATHFAVRVAEDIDKIPYENITNQYLNNYISNATNTDNTKIYNLPEDFNINVNIRNYNENDNSKEDILKIATIEVSYRCFNEDFSYKLQKLKIKEL